MNPTTAARTVPISPASPTSPAPLTGTGAASRLTGVTAVAVACALLAAGCATPGTPSSAAAAAPAAASPPAPVAAPAASPSGAAPASGTTAAAPSRPTSGTAAATPPRPAATPGAPPPFAEVTKDAKRTEGYLALWTRDEKTWLEIPAERLDQPLFLAVSFASGLGQGLFLPGLMGGEKVVVLRRVGNAVQMLARNLHARAPEGTPLARAVAESYSDSLLAVAPLAAAPHPERKSLLVDANALLGGDIAGLQTYIEATFRMAYGHDRANSSIERMRSGADGTTLTFRNHFAVPRLPPPPSMGPGSPPPNPATMPNPPRALPDPRSFFLSVAYSLSPLPAPAMKARRADQRVGYFTDAYVDFGNEFDGDRRVHMINRWRLEKKDPAAAVSEPKEPIRVVMDRNIPQKWRAAVREGILEWNKAFERAGFRNALAVEQQADDADWSAFEGGRLLAVRWFAMEGPGALAVGPSQSDPRTGEILRGAAIIPENWVRFDRNAVADVQPRLPGPAQGAGPEVEDPPARNVFGEFATRLMACTYAQEALERASFGHELLLLRGDLQPDSPQSTAYVAASLKAVVVHEVGHVLGLRHNFKASHGVSQAQLRDKGFTASRGISNSAMDYNVPNLPLEGEPITDIHMPGLGVYDYWAIEYGYREFAAADEAQALAGLAAQGDSDPLLAYGPDEDAAIGDPTINRFDQGDDTLAYARRELQLARELWSRTQSRTLNPDDTYEIYRRNLSRVFNRSASAVALLTKHVGGIVASRATAGSGKALVTPVPAAQQRAALDVLLGEVVASSSFRFDPKVLTRLGVDQFERDRSGRSVDINLGESVLGIQRSVLDGLMADATAARLAGAESKVNDPAALLSYAEVQQRLHAAIWSELAPATPARAGARRSNAAAPAAEIDSLRRTLQREHLRRLAAGVLRAAAPAAADVRAVHRQVALQLEAALKAALANGSWTATARAHLADSLATLTEALKAPLLKQGV